MRRRRWRRVLSKMTEQHDDAHARVCAKAEHHRCTGSQAEMPHCERNARQGPCAWQSFQTQRSKRSSLQRPHARVRAQLSHSQHHHGGCAGWRWRCAAPTTNCHPRHRHAGACSTVQTAHDGTGHSIGSPRAWSGRRANRREWPGMAGNGRENASATIAQPGTPLCARWSQPWVTKCVLWNAGGRHASAAERFSCRAKCGARRHVVASTTWPGHG